MSNSENENKPNQSNNPTKEPVGKKQRYKPPFSMLRWLRQQVKTIIWIVVVLFLASLFFIGYGTSVERTRRSEKEAEIEARENQESQLNFAMPEKLAGKGNETAVSLSYNSGNASFTGSIDAKTILRTLRSNEEYAKLQQRPEFKAFYGKYLKDMIVNRLIDLNLINLYAKANNIVPAVSVNDIIFRDKQQVSESEFNRTLRRRGLTLEEYGQERMQQITMSTVAQTAMTQVAPASATEDFLKNYYETNKSKFKKNDSISFDHLLVSPSMFDYFDKVTENDIKAYYEENKATFLSSKRVEVSHIFIDTTNKAYLDSVEVTDSMLEAAYNDPSNKSKFITDEEIKASHILIKPRGKGDKEKRFEEAKKVIQEIYEKAKNGGDFAELAKENSEDEGSAMDGGNLGFFERGAMVKPFEEVAFSSEIGVISEPVRTEFGYHIIKVEEKKPQKTITFDEAKEGLKSELKVKLADTKANLAIEELRSKIQKGEEDFLKAVKTYSLGKSAKNNGRLPIFFKGEITDDYAADDKLILENEVCDNTNFVDSEIEEKVFALQKSEISEVIKTNNGYHLFRLENTFEPIPLKLTSALEARIRSILENKGAEKEAKSVAEKLVKENSAASIEALAMVYGKDDEGTKHSFDNLPISKNPDMAYPEIAEGIGQFSDNGRTYLPEFHKQLMEMAKPNKQNQYSEPFKTLFGWHIIKVTNHKTEQYDSFADCRDTIRRITTFEPSDAEINNYYDETKQQYDIPAKRTVRQILCTDKDRADKVYKELQDGALFSKLARDYSSDPSSVNGGLMSPAPKGTYDPSLDKAIWELKKDEYTKPIELKAYGLWAIAKFESESPEVKASLDSSVTAKIKRTLREKNRDEAWQYFLKGLNNQAYVVRNQELIDLIE